MGELLLVSEMCCITVFHYYTAVYALCTGLSGSGDTTPTEPPTEPNPPNTGLIVGVVIGVLVIAVVVSLIAIVILFLKRPKKQTSKLPCSSNTSIVS